MPTTIDQMLRDLGSDSDGESPTALTTTEQMLKDLEAFDFTSQANTIEEEPQTIESAHNSATPEPTTLEREVILSEVDPDPTVDR